MFTEDIPYVAAFKSFILILHHHDKTNVYNKKS